MSASVLNLQDAINRIGTLDNASGQICQMKQGEPDLLLFEFGCPNCSEVPGKHSDEWGDALVTIVSAAPGLVTALDRYRAIVADTLQEVQNELRAGVEFENIMLAVAARIELRWMEAQR